MSKPKRFIQVGLGGFGQHWCTAVWPRLLAAGKAEAAAAVDLNPETFGNATQHLRLPAAKCYTDLRRALRENAADFVVIVVPPAHHERVVDAALAHGLHILSEKPVADTMAGCCRIYHKVRRTRRKMAVTMSHRFDQDKQSLEAAVKSGVYGPPPLRHPARPGRRRCQDRLRPDVEPAMGRVCRRLDRADHDRDDQRRQVPV